MMPDGRKKPKTGNKLKFWMKYSRAVSMSVVMYLFV
jgi:hypothetical protein